MAINFSDTLASIHADLSMRTIVFSWVLGFLLLLWFCWLFWVPMIITKQAVGEIEISQPVLSVVSSSSGRVERVNIHTGDVVSANEPLIVVSGDDEQKKIISLRTALVKQNSILDSLQKTQVNELNSLALEINALEEQSKNKSTQLKTVQEQFDQQSKTVVMLGGATSAVSKIELQREQLKEKQLHEHLLITQQELENLKTHYQQLKEQKKALLEFNGQSTAKQQALIASLEGDFSAQEQLLKHKNLTVSVAAKVAEVMPLQVGQWIEAGEPLATLFPQGDLRVVAQFKPVDAQGYIKLGQQAKIHVDNFPWLQYGALNAKVIHIEQAQRDGFIRVLLKLEDTNNLTLQHGMSASVSVMVANATPWQLLLQSLGRRQLNL